MAPPATIMAQQEQGDRIHLNLKPTATEAFAKDAILAWFRGEFAAANAIIDALCNHLTQLDDGAEYQSAFSAIHRRRLNWIPILQMQKYYSIGDVTMELSKVSEKRRAEIYKEENSEKDELNLVINNENGGGKLIEEDLMSDITDSGSQEVQPFPGNITICSNHEECEARRTQFKMIKGFVAKERVKGQTVNVVRGLKLFEDVFTHVELSKLNDFVNELRVAGQNGELSGETFILYNHQNKGNKRELVQLGVPIFGQVKKHDTDTLRRDCIEPIPALLQGVIDHLIQWRLIPQSRKPNSCIINFFDEGEYSQPFMKPPHLEHPLSTLLLSKSTMAFGHTLESDGQGNYQGPLVLSLKEGSLLVLKANSSETARHVMCCSQNKRVSITFFKVRVEVETNPLNAPSKAMTLWQPAGAMPIIHQPMGMIPKQGILLPPVVMVPSPLQPVAMSSLRRVRRGGTGVFLPWSVRSRKHVKHLPPRAQRGRLLALSSSDETV